MKAVPPPAEAAALLYGELLLLGWVRGGDHFLLQDWAADRFLFEAGLGLLVAVGFGLLLGGQRYRAAPLYARTSAALAGAFGVWLAPALLSRTPAAYQAFGPGLALMLVGSWAGLSAGWLLELGRLRRARSAILLRYSLAVVDSSLGVALRLLDAADVALGLRADRLSPAQKAQLAGRIAALRESANGPSDPRRLMVAVDQLAVEMMAEGAPWAPQDRS